MRLLSLIMLFGLSLPVLAAPGDLKEAIEAKKGEESARRWKLYVALSRYHKTEEHQPFVVYEHKDDEPSTGSVSLASFISNIPEPVVRKSALTVCLEAAAELSGAAHITKASACKMAEITRRRARTASDREFDERRRREAERRRYDREQQRRQRELQHRSLTY